MKFVHLDSSTVYSQESTFGDFEIGQIVISPGNWWSVTGYVSVDPGIPVVTVSASVLESCPTRH